MNIICKIMGKIMAFKWRYNVKYHIRSNFRFFSKYYESDLFELAIRKVKKVV